MNELIEPNQLKIKLKTLQPNAVMNTVLEI